MDLPTVLGILGLVGIIPVISAWVATLFSWRRVTHILGFGRTTPLDVIVTTSGYSKHRSGNSRSFKTNVGEVQAMGSVARALGAHYPRKAPRVHMSANIRNRLDSDTVVLGGPLLNDTAADFIAAFQLHYPASKIIHDAATQTLAVADFRRDNFDLERIDGVPGRDLILILLAWNLFGKNKARSILCAGFTTYGTAAAADLLFDDLTSKRYRRVSKRFHRDGGGAIVASARIVNQQCTHMRIEGIWTFKENPSY